jgi:hypothetical protein
MSGHARTMLVGERYHHNVLMGAAEQSPGAPKRSKAYVALGQVKRLAAAGIGGPEIG